MQANLEKTLIQLIRKTSTILPNDVSRALRSARRREKRRLTSRWILDIILNNMDLAKSRGAAICQDTGKLLFYCRVPSGYDINKLLTAVKQAIIRCSTAGILRQNTIETVSGRALETNIGQGSPVIHIDYHASRTLDIRLIMKGGGSENVSRQYSLPDMRLDAGRDPEGVRRCVLDAVQQAQGNGCAPGFLGVCIGGDRASGAEFAARQFLRPLTDHADNPALAKLEKKILRDTNHLGIGPMGLGGATTLLAVKIGALSRVPASYFVSIAYMCWAFRRQGVILGTDGRPRKWLYL